MAANIVCVYKLHGAAWFAENNLDRFDSRVLIDFSIPFDSVPYCTPCDCE